jgi:oligopeptide/dipeptide ABC transporter ATP-binding protein
MTGRFIQAGKMGHGGVMAGDVAAAVDTDDVLTVLGITTEIATRKGRFNAVDHVSLTLRRGETLALVGESGSGKSVTCHSIMQLIEKPASIKEGRALFRRRDGTRIDLLTEREGTLRNIRGNEIALIPQDSLGSLNPVLTIGAQLREVAQRHLHFSKHAAGELSIELLRKVGISDPHLRLNQYPHQLSGGMRQRVMIGIALICKPLLLIADEATTALDVTIQAQILDLIRDMGAGSANMAVLLITHDMGVVAQIANRVIVMYAGRIVEAGLVDQVLKSALHPYTRGLLNSIPHTSDTGLPKRQITPIPGMAPNPYDRPHGCTFAPRCSFAKQECTDAEPVLEDLPNDKQVRCIRWKELCQ